MGRSATSRSLGRSDKILAAGVQVPQACGMLFRSSILACCVLAAAPLRAAPVYSTDFGGGVTTDVFDISQGARVIHSTNQHNGAGESDVRQIFGLPASGAWVEPGNAIFADGPGAGFVDVVEWQT